MASRAEIEFRRSLLSKIVNYLESQFKESQGPATLDEILMGAREVEVSDRIKSWLRHEGFPKHPKIAKTRDGKYRFKPPLGCRDKKSLLQLLKRHYEEALGGIDIDDIYESVPNAERALEDLIKASVVNTITQPDEKILVFYYPNQPKPDMKEQFSDLFASVGNDGFDARKCGTYVELMEGRRMKPNPSEEPKFKKPTKRNVTDDVQLMHE